MQAVRIDQEGIGIKGHAEMIADPFIEAEANGTAECRSQIDA